jgi:hypothetical protein
MGKVMVMIFTMQKTDNNVLWLIITNNLEGKKFIVSVNHNCDKITVAFEKGSQVDNMQ